MERVLRSLSNRPYVDSRFQLFSVFSLALLLYCYCLLLDPLVLSLLCCMGQSWVCLLFNINIIDSRPLAQFIFFKKKLYYPVLSRYSYCTMKIAGYNSLYN